MLRKPLFNSIKIPLLPRGVITQSHEAGHFLCGLGAIVAFFEVFFGRGPCFVVRHEAFAEFEFFLFAHEGVADGGQLAGVEEETAALVAFVYVHLARGCVLVPVHDEAAFGTVDAGAVVVAGARGAECGGDVALAAFVAFVEPDEFHPVEPLAAAALRAHVHLDVHEVLFGHRFPTRRAVHFVLLLFFMFFNFDILSKTTKIVSGHK